MHLVPQKPRIDARPFEISLRDGAAFEMAQLLARQGGIR